jgi:AcrR family transcriptional regulator
VSTAAASATTSSRDRLVRAAADLLSEVGPRAVSVRAIAERAEVNHGLVHYYFGGKDALLGEAMAELVERHRRLVDEMTAGRPRPVPLGLSRDMDYLRAVVRCVLDGEMGLALTELRLGASVPRAALEDVLSSSSGRASTEVITTTVLLAAALEMGWAALEPFLFAVADIGPDEQESVRAIARTYRIVVDDATAPR